MGIYHEHYRESKGGQLLRSVYRHESLPVYLYFHQKDRTWAISNTVGSSKCWLFSSDTAQKPHLIVAPWLHLDPEEKKWRTETTIRCEPKIEGASGSERTLATQAKAMKSVVSAVRAESIILKTKLAELARRKRFGDVVALRQRQKELEMRMKELEKRAESLSVIKGKCESLKKERAILDERGRDLMDQITQGEKYQKNFHGAMKHDQRPASKYEKSLASAEDAPVACLSPRTPRLPSDVMRATSLKRDAGNKISSESQSDSKEPPEAVAEHGAAEAFDHHGDAAQIEEVSDEDLEDI